MRALVESTTRELAHGVRKFVVNPERSTFTRKTGGRDARGRRRIVRHWGPWLAREIQELLESETRWPGDSEIQRLRGSEIQGLRGWRHSEVQELWLTGRGAQRFIGFRVSEDDVPRHPEQVVGRSEELRSPF